VDEPYDYRTVNLTEEGTIWVKVIGDFVAFCAACPRLRVAQIRRVNWFLRMAYWYAPSSSLRNDAFMQRFVLQTESMKGIREAAGLKLASPLHYAVIFSDKRVKIGLP
jgi:hypothetical protein